SGVMRSFRGRAIELMYSRGEPVQESLNYALDEMKDRVSFAPFAQSDAPNGFTYFVQRLGQLEGWARKPYVAHANWMVGKYGKKMRMINEGAWLLSSDLKGADRDPDVD